MSKKYDVFISYRRQGGEATAKIIYDRLSSRGQWVFYDVEALRSGAFNTKLYSIIEECKDFIIILSPDSLDRCSNENDWVRLEIAHALKLGKNVIPIFLRGFQFPEEMPEDIADLRYQNGLEANSDFFDAFIERLCSFLESKPTLLQRIHKNTLLKRSILITLAILVVLILFLRAPAVLQSWNQTFPRTRVEKFIIEETFSYIEKNLSMIDAVTGDVSMAYEECENYLINEDPAQYKRTMSTINMAYNKIDKLNISIYTLSSNLSDIIDTTPINRVDLVAVNGYNQALCESYIENLLFLKQVFMENSSINNTTKKGILDIYTEMLESDNLSIIYGINDLLLPINNTYLKDFKQTYLFTLRNLPFSTQAWLSNNNEKNEISRVADSIYQKQLQQNNELLSLLGIKDYTKLIEKSEIEQYGHEKGLSQSEIDLALNSYSTTSITNIKQQLDDVKNQARIKFAPEDEDKPEILWGKMLRFLNLQISDEAIQCAEMYQSKVEKDYPEAKVYVPAVIRFINQISLTGIDYGVVVCAYEPGKPKHAIYEIGDIIIAINGSPCFNYNDYVKIKPSNEEYTVTLLRPDKNNTLNPIDITVPNGQPKIQIMDLTEKE